MLLKIEGCGAPTDQGHRTVARKRHVPQGFTDNDAETRIMVFIRENIPCCALGGYDGTDNNSISDRILHGWSFFR